MKLPRITREREKKGRISDKIRHQITIDSFKFNLLSHRFHSNFLFMSIHFVRYSVSLPPIALSHPRFPLPHQLNNQRTTFNLRLSGLFIGSSLSGWMRSILPNRFSSFFFHFRRFFTQTNSPSVHFDYVCSYV